MAKRLDDETIKNMTRKEGTLYPVPYAPGLFIRFGKHVKTFTAVTRDAGGRQIWTKLGRTDRMKLEAAMKAAPAIIDRIRDGQASPTGGDDTTMAAIVKDYKKTAQHQRRWRDKERRLEKWILPRFGKVSITTITRGQVNGLLNDVGSPKCADQVLMDLYALEKHFLTMESVPNEYTMRFRGGIVPKRSKANKRRRVLNSEELRAVWYAAGYADRFGVVLKLCLLTGQRITKVLSMEWGHVKFDKNEWHVPRAPREKGVPEILPLSPQAVALIQTQEHLTDFVFPSVRGNGCMCGLSELKRNFQATLPPMPQWQIHDLRRTAKTRMTELGVQKHVSEKILGHELGGVEGTYDIALLVDPMREALVKLANHIEEVVGAAPVAKAA
jgi:integrase